MSGKIKQNVTNFERKHVSQNKVAMATSSSGHNELPYISLVTFNKIFKKLKAFKVSALSIAIGIRNDKHATFCILKLQGIDIDMR